MTHICLVPVVIFVAYMGAVISMILRDHAAHERADEHDKSVYGYTADEMLSGGML